MWEVRSQIDMTINSNLFFRIIITSLDQSVGMKTRLKFYVPRVLYKDRRSRLQI